MTMCPHKVSQRIKRSNLKTRKTSTKRRNKAKRKPRRRTRRPKRNFLEGRRFYTLEAFIRWLHQFIGGLIDQRLKHKANQAKYSHEGLLFALILRCILGTAELSRFVENLESNPALSRTLGFLNPLKNTKPLTELLLKLSLALSKWLFLQLLLEARALGLVFGKTVAIDTCFLHIHGKTYEKAKKGYSGQLKRRVRGYKLWVVFSVESKMPLAFYLDSGNVHDTKHFKRCISKAGYVLGEGVMQRVIADRGFCSRGLYLWLERTMQLKFVFRAKAGKSSAYIQNAVDSLQSNDFRYLGAKTRYAKVDVQGFKGQRLRLFVGKHKGFQKEFLLITNDFSLEYRGARRVYLSRWSVESHFKNQKCDFLLGKFSCTKWGGVFAEVTLSLLTSVLLSIFQLLLSKRYRKFSSNEFIERVLLHGFVCDPEQIKKPHYARGRPIVAALQRLDTFLKQWGTLEKHCRFERFRPKGFNKEVFDLPDLSVVPKNAFILRQSG